MPFPSRACRTCRQRHVKCDETYPICNRCVKAGKVCLGFNTRPDHFAFRDENIFAGGIPRRPRDLSQNASNTSVKPLTTASHGPSTSTSASPVMAVSVNSFPSHQQIYRHMASRPVSVPRLLSENVEVHALADFAQRYSSSKSQVSNGLWHHLSTYRSEWEMEDKHSLLRLVTGAFALAVFGRVHNSSTATQMSIARYNHAVSRMHELLQDNSQVSDDRTLITIMVLDAYEGAIGEAGGVKLQSPRLWHQQGAATLLKLRQERARFQQRTSDLDRDVRRQLVRASILRGMFLPDWLHDGSKFGEEGVELRLDRCLVEMSKLRFVLQTLLECQSGNSQSQKQMNRQAISNLVRIAVINDNALVAWAASLPLEWTCVVHHDYNCTSFNHEAMDSSTDSDSIFNSDAKLRVARAWDTYRALRLITNGIIARFSDGSHVNRRDTADLIINSLVEEICDSAKSYLGEVGSNRGNGLSVDPAGPVREAPDGITAQEVGLLIFPLCIAAANSRINDSQRARILAHILGVSKITGSNTLEKFATGSSFVLK